MRVFDSKRELCLVVQILELWTFLFFLEKQHKFLSAAQQVLSGCLQGSIWVSGGDDAFFLVALIQMQSSFWERKLSPRKMFQCKIPFTDWHSRSYNTAANSFFFFFPCFTPLLDRTVDSRKWERVDCTWAPPTSCVLREEKSAVDLPQVMIQPDCYI